MYKYVRNISIAQAIKEWIALRKYAERSMKNISNKQMWARFFRHQGAVYRNILLLVEIMMVLSPSNSVVERGFSILRNILSDKRLRFEVADF